VRGDAGALEQLFVNLLLNAAQAVEEKGSASVGLGTNDQMAVITIEDTGPGIPVELRDRIFEPFFSTRAEGTGLGLAIARRIARVHGGRLRLAEPTRTGAAFEVLLPLAPAEET
jgi:signal transduction histidine kinase